MIGGLVGGQVGTMRLLNYWDLNGQLDSGNEIDIDVSAGKGLILSLTGGTIGTTDFVTTRFSTNGGTSFRSGASDYSRGGFTSSGPFTSDVSSLLLSTTGTSGLGGFAQFMGFNNASINVAYAVTFRGGTSVGQQTGNNKTAEAVDTVRVLTDGGNAMTAGQLVAWLIL